ncbi:Ig-like domain-containing protein [Citricoccus sp. GCM10030269]|uniref:Ig-like domain-containing protein n=1 Tax=Citricoccus sp. GCM10030269 TaxID=3273388 RepID=UPI0036169043
MGKNGGSRRAPGWRQGAALASLGGVVAAGALLYPGFETASLDLHDGGIWVTSAVEDSIGHLNVESSLLDGGLSSPFTDYELHQDDSVVLALEPSSGVLARIDPATMALSEQVMLPGTQNFRLAGGTASAANPQDGTVFGALADPLPAFDESEPLYEGDGAVLSTTTEDGEVLVVDVQTETLHRFTPSTAGTDAPSDSGPLKETSTAELPGVGDLSEPALSAVGKTGVVHDAGSGTVLWDGGRLEDPVLAGTRLQAPGPEADVVVLTGPRSTVTVPLSGGTPQVTDLTAPDEAQSTAGSRDSAAEPVVVEGCTHAASAATGTYLRDCEGTEQDALLSIPDLADGAELIFRTNRSSVVLNDMRSGDSWVANEDLRVISNWEDLKPPTSQGEDTEEDSDQITRDVTLPDRDEENRPPVAQDDTFGVRAGRMTALPVLVNDSDPDGDVLTVSAEKDAGLDRTGLGDVQPIHDGVGFQVAADADATGTSTFDYTADDGRGGTDTASVTLRVVPETANDAPRQLRVPTITVRAGESATAPVLTDWLDPDGDDLRLVDAVAEEPDSTRVRPDGELTFQDGTGDTGTRTVSMTVTDGRETATGEVQVRVIGGQSEPPVTVADHVVAVAGQETIIRPLDNDEDPLGGVLRLAYAGMAPNSETAFNPEAGTVQFTSDTPGTYYLDYVAANEADSAPGLIRVDVRPEGGGTGRPIAVADTALLPAGGDVLVDVTANDTDPGGGVLVVQGIEGLEGADGGAPPVKVAVENYSVLRVVDAGGLSSPLTFRYQVSNAEGTTDGEVTVVPLPEPATVEPPVANPDEAVVRAGDVVTVDVLANDSHPDGSELVLAPELEESVLADRGLSAVSQGKVRFLASAETGRTSAVYTVRGPDGQQASARVEFTVMPVDRETNAPPVPPHLKARVLAGETVRIPVPLDGTDPDGDSVQLVALDSTPEQGSVTVNGGFLEYSASDGAGGTDTFTYVVEDRLGARAVGSVSVGVARPLATNHPPVAVDDSVEVRPGRTFTVDVLDNDADPDGDPVALVAGGVSTPNSDVTVREVEGRLSVTAPEEDGFTNILYRVTDPYGATDTGTLTVAVDQDAVLLPPLARDDWVGAEQIRGQDDVVVDVLANDEDPDGSASDLAVSLLEGAEGAGEGSAGAAEVLDDQRVRITVTDSAQVIPYRVTDQDDQSATAFIFVPGNATTPPWLIDGAPREVRAGEPLSVDLDEAIGARGGRAVRLLREDSASAAPSAASVEVSSGTELVFRAPEDYAGAASLNVTVTDGESAEDPTGLTSTLTIPVMVLPAPETNRPPTVRSSAVRVEAGGEATADLSLLASDPDDDDLTLQLGETPEELDVELSGAVVTIAAPADAVQGTESTVEFTASDGQADAVRGTVSVTVVGSDRPLPRAVDDVVDEARPGEQVLVDVLANDVNPFEGEEPLRISSVGLATGTAEVLQRGDQLAITPGEDFSGRLRATYQVRDATGDPARTSEATVTVVVAGTPGTPGAPRADAVSDGAVDLSWTAPPDQGSPITHYVVTTVGTGETTQCATTSCRITGLTNGTEHRFTATAVNEIGESDPSASSAPVTPDVRPDAPGAPEATPGDAVVDLRWAAPENRGSAITGYRVRVSPAAPGGGTVRSTGAATSLRWDGLQNGVRYRFQVQALNGADEPSDWGPYSSAAAPAGAPDRPSAPSATHVTSVIDGGAVDVSWAMPNTNGAAIDRYTVTAHRGGSTSGSRSVSGTTTTARFTGLDPSASYTFTVRATNRVGDSPPSASSRAVTPYGRPSAVSSVSTSATGKDRQLKVSYSAASGNGSPVTGYQYSLNGGNWQSLGSSGSIIPVPANGTAYRIKVRALNASGPGPASAATTTDSAFGPLKNAAQIRSSPRVGSVVFSWNSRAADYANGRPITSMTVKADGRTVANSGSTTVSSSSASTVHRLQITVCAEDSRCRTFAGTASSTAPPPKPSPTPTRPAPSSSPSSSAPPTAPRAKWNLSENGGGPAGCERPEPECTTSVFVAEDFEPNTQYRMDCFSQGGQNYYTTSGFTTDARGNWTGSVCTYRKFEPYTSGNSFRVEGNFPVGTSVPGGYSTIRADGAWTY